MSQSTRRLSSILLFLPLACFMHALGCDRDANSMMQGQSNVSMTFHGKAVDQDGAPLPNVAFEFRLEAYPKDWSFETRGRPYDVTNFAATTDASGRFELKLNGCMLRMVKAESLGYRQLEELDSSDQRSNGRTSVFTRSIRLMSWGEQQYKNDLQNPAVYVFVKDGEKLTKALPSRGGFNALGKQWIQNEPGWPDEPSLFDVDWVDGQARVNVDVPIVLKAVDTNGTPLKNVSIAMDVEEYRAVDEMRSSNQNRTRRTKKTRASATTNQDGLARTTIHGFRFGGVYNTQVDGAKWGTGPVLIESLDFQNYYSRELMDKAGNAIYRCDETNPMVLVFVEREAREAYFLPSPGGYELRDGAWIRVEPRWPDNVRHGIRFVPPSSQPSR